MEEVKEQLGNLRVDKAPGPDNMQLRVLMEVAEQVSDMFIGYFQKLTGVRTSTGGLESSKCNTIN